MNDWKDRVGQQILEGDVVCYVRSRARGSNDFITGRIDSFTSKMVRVTVLVASGGERVGNVLVVDAWRLVKMYDQRIAS